MNHKYIIQYQRAFLWKDHRACENKEEAIAIAMDMFADGFKSVRVVQRTEAVVWMGFSESVKEAGAEQEI